MGKKKVTPLELGKRERQIAETVVKLGEASVSEVLEGLENPPSYSAVRAIMGVLVQKKRLKFRRDGKRFLYRPYAGREKSQQTAVASLVETFFGGSAADAMAALLDSPSGEVSDAELARMMDMIKKARKENR